MLYSWALTVYRIAVLRPWASSNAGDEAGVVHGRGSGARRTAAPIDHCPGCYRIPRAMPLHGNLIGGPRKRLVGLAGRGTQSPGDRRAALCWMWERSPAHLPSVLQFALRKERERGRTSHVVLARGPERVFLTSNAVVPVECRSLRVGRLTSWLNPEGHLWDGSRATESPFHVALMQVRLADPTKTVSAVSCPRCGVTNERRGGSGAP